MQHISEHLNVSNFSVAREEKKTQTVLDPLSVRLVDYIFAKFMLLCKGFDAKYQNDTSRLNAEKTQWSATFSREKITTLEQIKSGLLKLEKHVYPNPPQLGEFLSWCIPTADDLNLPNIEFAYDEACRNAHPSATKVWTHEVVKHAAKATGSYLLSNSPRSKSFPVFQRNYEIACRKFIKGESISDIPKGIADHRKSREGVLPEFQACNSYESAMESIKQKLRMK